MIGAHTRKLGAALLLAGSCIGIGMLAMPVAMGLAGFGPTCVMLIIGALFMGATALLLVEVDLGDQVNANLLTLAEHTLGTWAKRSVWISYLFLFYCLMVAYIAKGGEVLFTLMESWGVPFATDFSTSIALVLIAAVALFYGRRIVDLTNRLFMVGLFVSYAVMMVYGFQAFEAEHLAYTNLEKMVPMIPFAVIAFGFHNMIPTLADYLRRDRGSLVQAILWGCGIVFAIYVLWSLVVQASAPVLGPGGMEEAFTKGWIGTQLLYAVSKSVAVKVGALYLSFFAIITSILGQGLGLTDFLFDGFGIERRKLNRAAILALIFIPSFFAAHWIPGVFFLALELAGGVAAVFLFCLIPVLMAWSYRKETGRKRLLPGGRPMLIVIGSMASLILVYEGFHFLFKLI